MRTTFLTNPMNLVLAAYENDMFHFVCLDHANLMGFEGYTTPNLGRLRC